MTDWDHADKVYAFLSDWGDEDPERLYCSEHERWEPCRTCLYDNPVPEWEVAKVVGEVLRDHGVWRSTVRDAVTTALREKFVIKLKSPKGRMSEREEAG